MIYKYCNITNLLKIQNTAGMHMNSIFTGLDYMSKKSLKIPKVGNQNPYIEEEQTTQWPKEKVQKDKQRSTKHTHKTKDRVTRTQLKTVG